MGEKTGRIEYLDIARGIGIILVIMGHTGFLSKGLQNFVSSFHMPLFFVISGILLSIKEERTPEGKSFVKSLLKKLMIPYLSFSLIYILVYYIEYRAGITDALTIRQNIIYMCTFFGDSVLWFLSSLFIAEAGFVFFYRKYKDNKAIYLSVFAAVFVLSLILSQILTGIWAKEEGHIFIINLIDFVRGILRGFIAMGFLFAGFYADRLLKKKEIVINKWLALAVGIFSLLLTAIISQINDRVDFHRLYFGNYLLFFAAALLGSFGVILISYTVGRFRILEFWGRNSLIIMCTHLNLYVLYVAIQWAWLLDSFITRAKSYFFMLNILLAAMVIETAVIYLINYIFPFLIGKNYPQKGKR